MTKITLRAKTDPTITITGELTGDTISRYLVRLAPDLSAHSFLKAQWERGYDLPTVPGTVIRATIRGVPNMRAFRVDGEESAGSVGYWRSVRGIEEWRFHRDEDIDASTVVVELEGDEENR